MQYEDVKPGELINVSVVGVEKFGMLVDVTDSIRALCPLTASQPHIDLDRAPYVLYGVKYIGLVSLAPLSTLRWPAGHKVYKIKMAYKQHLDSIRPRL